MIEYDSRILRLKKQYQGLSRLMTSISDLYIYGVYPQNYPNLSVVLDQTKDHVKQILKETKAEIASLEEPHSKYDLIEGDKIEIVEDYEWNDWNKIRGFSKTSWREWEFTEAD